MRARRIQYFLTQPFVVAEPWTGIPGEYVSIEDALAGLSGLLEGRYDDVPEEGIQICGRHRPGARETAISVTRSAAIIGSGVVNKPIHHTSIVYRSGMPKAAGCATNQFVQLMRSLSLLARSNWAHARLRAKLGPRGTVTMFSSIIKEHSATVLLTCDLQPMVLNGLFLQKRLDFCALFARDALILHKDIEQISQFEDAVDGDAKRC